MSFFSRLPLGQKLIILLLLISCTVLSLAAAGFVLNDWITSRKQASDALNAQAEIISNNSVAALLFNDPDAANRNLESLRQIPDLVQAVIYDAQKAPFASYPAEADEVPPLPAQWRGERDQTLYVVVPVIMSNERVGYTLLIRDLRSLNEKRLQQLGITAIVFLLSLIVALILSRRAQRIITGPISELAQTAREITETRQYDLRVRNTTADEIGSLATDFNRMVEQIQQRDDELQQARQLLEHKVEERTAELIELTGKLKHQAYHDSLTGLPNRSNFDDSLHKAISLSQREKSQLAVMFLDLDRFKDINDTLGHDIGDRLLTGISRRLQATLRTSDTLARLGGDEFAVLGVNASPDQAAIIANKLIEAIREPIQIDDFNLQVTTSIGISIYPEDGTDAATILKHADMAMYSAKAAGKNQLSFFAREMNQRSERRLLLEHKLRSAIANDRFMLWYQPKWCCRRLTIVGVEALIRWQDEEEGFISPAEFIPLAEDCGLIGVIDQWVLEKACSEIDQINRQIKQPVMLSVNFSPAHLIRQDIYKRISNTLNRTGFPANLLELEITETVVATENKALLSQLDDLRDLGVSLSIDDFGIAYSSLSRLKQLPITTLKIDRSFVRDIGKDHDDEVIVKTVIDMAHNLNMHVVAEGVETEQQFNFVRQHECDLIQGYLFSKPMPLNELHATLLKPELPEIIVQQSQIR